MFKLPGKEIIAFYTQKFAKLGNRIDQYQESSGNVTVNFKTLLANMEYNLDESYAPVL